MLSRGLLELGDSPASRFGPSFMFMILSCSLKIESISISGPRRAAGQVMSTGTNWWSTPCTIA